MGYKLSSGGTCAIIANRSYEAGLKAGESIQKGEDKVEAIPTDASKSDQVTERVRQVKDKFRRIDLPMNNVSVIKPAMPHKMTEEQKDQVC